MVILRIIAIPAIVLGLVIIAILICSIVAQLLGRADLLKRLDQLMTRVMGVTAVYTVIVFAVWITCDAIGG